MSDRIKVRFITGNYSRYDNSNYREGVIYYLEDSTGTEIKYRVFLNGKEYSVQSLNDMILPGGITVSHDIGGYAKGTVINSGSTLLSILNQLLSGSISQSSVTFDVESRRVINVLTPVNDTDAANKKYVDDSVVKWERINQEVIL